MNLHALLFFTFLRNIARIYPSWLLSKDKVGQIIIIALTA
jgi:hypothetical protein